MIDLVVKLGGALLRDVRALDRAVRAVEVASAHTRLAVVPGGGPFADAVRAVDRSVALGDHAAHWMAVLAMDQYAHLLAARIQRARIVEDGGDIDAALSLGDIPVLAPYRWLREADPLPHSWDVTSDSVAAWLAGALGAHRLVLVKRRGGEPAELSDSYFARALPTGLTTAVVSADDAIPAALFGS